MPTVQPPIDLGSWMARRAAISPNRPALTFEGRTRTFGEFSAEIDRLAGALVAGGVRAGDRVAYVGLNHPAFLVTLFACSRAGATFVPLNFRLSGPELAYILGDSGARTVIADVGLATVIDSVRADIDVQRFIALGDLHGWEHYDEVVGAAEAIAQPEHPGLDDVAIIMYTSGTTGRPKGAMLTHGNLFWNNMNSLLSFDTQSTDVSLVCAPLFHIGGLNVTTLVTLQKGGHVVLMPTFEPQRALQHIADDHITTLFGVPAMFLFMTQVPGFDDVDFSSIRFLICGGAPVPEPLMRRYGERGVVFAQGYGLTETAPLALVMGIDESADKIGAAGNRVLPLSDVCLMDPAGQQLGPGARGEVCVRGPQVMAGYWNNSAATAAAIDADGWFHTGDVGRMDDDGYVYVVDRVKDMVITGGENVYPAEVESVLYSHPAVAEVAVLGTPDDTWGEAVTAVVALAPEASLTLEELRDFARDQLAGYKLPLRIEFVDALPRNASGKVLKFRLREELAGQ